MAKLPTCDYCGKPAVLLKHSGRLYHGRDFGPAWVCWPCNAWVGCHKGTHRPLGRLANVSLRKAKIAAHYAFDRLWKRGPMERKEAYKWLAGALGIDPKDCHIGMFDEARCREVVAMCRGYADLLVGKDS